MYKVHETALRQEDVTILTPQDIDMNVCRPLTYTQETERGIRRRSEH